MNGLTILTMNWCPESTKEFKNIKIGQKFILTCPKPFLVYMVLKSSNFNYLCEDDILNFLIRMSAVGFFSFSGTEILFKLMSNQMMRPSSGPSPLHFAVISNLELVKFLVNEVSGNLHKNLIP